MLRLCSGQRSYARAERLGGRLGGRLGLARRLGAIIVVEPLVIVIVIVIVVLLILLLLLGCRWREMAGYVHCMSMVDANAGWERSQPAP